MSGARLLDRPRAAWCVVALLVAVVAGLWVWVQSPGGFPPDEALRGWMIDPSSLPEAIHAVTVAYDALGFPAVAVVTVAILAWVVTRRLGPRFGVLLVAAAGVPALTTVLKAILGTAPLQHEVRGDHPAFPSGHTAYAAALFGFLAWLALWRRRRDLAAAALVVVVGMGPARIAQAAHWPSDVIAGYAIGFAWLLAVLLIGLPWAAMSTPGPR